MIRSFLALDKCGRELVRSKQLIQDLTDSLKINGQSLEHWLFLTRFAERYKIFEIGGGVAERCDACRLQRRLTKRIVGVCGSHELDVHVGCICFAKIDVCRRMHEWWANNLLSVRDDAIETWRSLYYDDYMSTFE